jgi:hypothetical protein
MAENSAKELKTCSQKCLLQKKLVAVKLQIWQKEAENRPQNIKRIVHWRNHIIFCVFLDFFTRE